MNYGGPTVWHVSGHQNDTSPEEDLPQHGVQSDPADEEALKLSPEIYRLGHIAYNLIAPTIIGFGIFTNLLNLVVLSRPTLRGPTYRYLMWLAVANLLVCIVLLPFTLHTHNSPVRYFSAFYFAHLEMPLGNALIASGVYITVGLSIDRFVAVCHPRKYRNLHSHRVASIRIGVSFAIAFLIYIPMTFGKRPVYVTGTPGGYIPKENFVVTRTKWWIIYKSILEISARFAPALLLAFLNIWIIIEFKKISERRRHLSQNMAELSGFPSQSAAELSQATAQRYPKEETSHFMNQEKTGIGPCDEIEQDPKHSSGELATEKSEIIENENSIRRNTEPTAANKKRISIQEPNSSSAGDGDNTNTNTCRVSSSLISTQICENGFSTDKEGQLYIKESPFETSTPETAYQEISILSTGSEPHMRNSYPSGGGLVDPLERISEIGQERQDSWVRNSHASIPGLLSHGKRSSKTMSAKRLDRERRLILLLVSIIIAFFITNIPTAILSLTITEERQTIWSYQVFRAVANNLEFFNFGLNFILYFLISQDIRNAFLNVLRNISETLRERFTSNSLNKQPI